MSCHRNYHKKIFEHTEALYEAVANIIIDKANQAQRSGKKFSIALSGGQTPEELFKLLSIPLYACKIPWQNMYIFWGDERCVPLDDNRNNAYRAKTLLLNNVPIPAENIFRIPVDMPPVKASKTYKKIITDFFKGEKMAFDLILLGLGENGHTASLFPGTSVIYVQEKDVREIYLEDEKMFRITMTVPLINDAHHILFMVTGSNKADIVKEVLNGEYQPSKYPAQLISPENGDLTWYLDHDAAAEIV